MPNARVHSQAVALAIPIAELVILERGGHANTVETPTELAAALLKFLRRP